MVLTITKHFIERAEQRMFPWWKEINPDGTLEEFYVWVNGFCHDRFGAMCNHEGVLDGVDSMKISWKQFQFCFSGKANGLSLNTVIMKEEMLKPIKKMKKRRKKDSKDYEPRCQGELDFDL